MSIEPRAVGLGMCIGGTTLWIIAIVVDAPLVSIVLSLLIVIGGALMVVLADAAP